MERLIIAALLIAVAIVVAAVLERRRSANTTSSVRNELPAAVDLEAIGLGDGPAIVVFSAETCRSCAAALGVVRGPAGAGLPVADVPHGSQRELHRQHRIGAVPTTVVVAADGNVVDGWTGRVDLSGLAEALTEVLGRPRPRDG